jgi:hypothetical protein
LRCGLRGNCETSLGFRHTFWSRNLPSLSWRRNEEPATW